MQDPTPVKRRRDEQPPDHPAGSSEDLHIAASPSEQSGGQVRPNPTKSKQPNEFLSKIILLPKQRPYNFVDQMIENNRDRYDFSCNQLDSFVKLCKPLSIGYINPIVDYLAILDPRHRNFEIHIQNGIHKWNMDRDHLNNKYPLPTFTSSASFYDDSAADQIDGVIVTFKVGQGNSEHWVMGISIKGGDIFFFDTLGLPPTKEFDVIMANSLYNPSHHRNEEIGKYIPKDRRYIDCFQTKIESIPHVFFPNMPDFRYEGTVKGARICVQNIVRVDPDTYPHLDPENISDSPTDPCAGVYILCAIVRNFLMPMEILPMNNSNYFGLMLQVLEDLYPTAWDFDDVFEKRIRNHFDIIVNKRTGLTLNSHITQLMIPPKKNTFNAHRQAALRDKAKNTQKNIEWRAKNAQLRANSSTTVQSSIQIAPQPISSTSVPQTNQPIVIISQPEPAIQTYVSPQPITPPLLPINDIAGQTSTIQKDSDISLDLIRKIHLSKWFDEDDWTIDLDSAKHLDALISYYAKLSKQNVLFLSAINFKENERLHLYSGDLENFDVAFIPVLIRRDFNLVIYEKSKHNIISIGPHGSGIDIRLDKDWNCKRLLDILKEINPSAEGNPSMTPQYIKDYRYPGMDVLHRYPKITGYMYSTVFYIAYCVEGYLLYGHYLIPGMNLKKEIDRQYHILISLCSDKYPMYRDRYYIGPIDSTPPSLTPVPTETPVNSTSQFRITPSVRDKIQIPYVGEITNLEGKNCTIRDITHLNEQHIMNTYQDPENNLLDAENVFALCCYFADIYGDRVLVISPEYTIAGLDKNRFKEIVEGNNIITRAPTFAEMIEDFGQEFSLFYGDRENFTKVIIPVAHGQHFSMALYDKSKHTITYTDSIDVPMNVDVRARLNELIRDIAPSKRYDPRVIEPRSKNIQAKEYECGFYSALAAEGYLLYSDIYIYRLDFGYQFSRLIDFLLALCEGKYPEYKSRQM